MTSPLLVYCTCPDSATAERIAALLVERHLAGCVTLLPGAKSLYRWQGSVEQASEVLLLIKTDETRWAALEAQLSAAHPYDVPEIIATPLTRGAAPYLAWLREALEEDPSCAG